MTKAELRLQYREKRKQLSPDKLEQLSEEICQKAMSHFQLENKIISLFLPIERQFEINTYLLWEKARSFGAKIAVPKANFETHELIHILFDSHDQLEISSYGIPEPKNGKVISPIKFDFVFIPLITVDPEGHRVGYGKGFYDRFLKKCATNCLFIGLHLFNSTDQIDDILPTDIKLDFCITPDEIIRFGV